VDFAVSEGFGKLSGKTALTVYTNAQSTACGYPFRLSVEYFVSANSVESKLWTSSCGHGYRTAGRRMDFGRLTNKLKALGGDAPARRTGRATASQAHGWPDTKQKERCDQLHTT